VNATNPPRGRDAARARLEKDMAERKATAMKRRKMWTGIGAGTTAVVVIGGSVWIYKVATYKPPVKTTATCAWQDVPAKPGQPSSTKDVGKPPTEVPKVGTRTMTVRTNFGDIPIALDLSKAPCTDASMSFLASKAFWDGTKCHRMFPGMLQCGDPLAKGKGYRPTDGRGGPSYVYGPENLPVNLSPAYPAGTVAMANNGQDPISNGSQFFFIYDTVNLASNYTVFGKVDSAGLSVLKKATAAGDDKAFEPQPGGGHPKKDVNIQTITVN